MNNSMNSIERALGSSLRRREFLTKAAAAGAIAWTAPVILSRPAYAVEGGAGSAACRPNISAVVTTHSCPRSSGGGGAQTFPAVKITVSDCRCSTLHPKVCVDVADFNQLAIPVIPLNPSIPQVQVYGDTTACTAVGATESISTTGWTPVIPAFAGNPPTGTKVIFLGNPREGGGTGQIRPPGQGTNQSAVLLYAFTFRLAVWAGNCPDSAYNCQTFLVTILWSSTAILPSSLLAPLLTTGITVAGPLQSLCTTGAASPC